MLEAVTAAALVTPLLNGDSSGCCPSIWSTPKANRLLSLDRGDVAEVAEVIVESLLDIHGGLTWEMCLIYFIL